MLRSIRVLRAVAAIAVVIDHGDRQGLLNGASVRGAAGVDLFFVISGFIMATVAKDQAPLRFLANRAWRILPMWFFALIPWLIVQSNDWRIVLASLTLWPIWGNSFTMPALGVGWSLCFEMLFYMAFAIALAGRVLLPLSVFAIALLLTPATGCAFLGYIGSPLIFEFLAGVFIARLPFCESLGPPLLLLGMAWFVIAPPDYRDIVFGDPAFFRVMSWGVPAALIVYSARCLENRFGRCFDFLVLLGNASYAIYLFHPIAVRFVSGLLPGLVLSLLAGLIVHFVLERPLLKLRRTRAVDVLAPA